MNLETIQTSIVDKLQVAFVASSLEFQAKALPDAEADYKKYPGKVTAYIVYTGSTSQGMSNTNPVTQVRRLQFAVELFSRALYGASGLFIARDYVEKALIGFRPANCDRLYLVKDDIDKGEDSFWTHVYRLECVTMLVQDDLSEVTLGESFTRLDSTFEGETTTIIPNQTV